MREYKDIVKEFFNRNNLKYEENKIIDEKTVDISVDGFNFIIRSLLDFNVFEEEYCRNNKVIVITNSDVGSRIPKPNGTSSNGLKYLKKCPNPLIGVDISLFDNPEFPYAKDKPKCFYDVRVDGKMSAHEAWNDEKIRWNMIKNRIEYSGGFIDNKQILNAMNISRTCKQPSWFAKSFAKELIEKYLTSNTIVDCFAGWGARADACKELKLNYIGIDYNEELVEWHKSLNRNIEYGDANKFTYDEECSVFICPPYSDPKTGRCFEDYNFTDFDNSAKALSQCDWLKIVMKNVPNAKEYLMVCKVVDSGFEKYIVDTKKNRSHFGINNEYVILIKNENKEEAIK